MIGLVGARLLGPVIGRAPGGRLGPTGQILQNLFFDALQDFIFPAPADAPGMPYGPGYPGQSYPFQPAPPPSPSNPAGPTPYTDSSQSPTPLDLPNGTYKISDVRATFRKDFWDTSLPSKNVVFAGLSGDGVVVSGSIKSVTGLSGTYGQNSTFPVFIRMGSGTVVVRPLYPEGDHGTNGNHTLVSMSYQITRTDVPPSPPPLTDSPPPYSFNPNPPPLPTPSAPPSGPGPLTAPPPREKEQNPVPPGRGPIKTPPNKAPGAPPANPPGTPPVSPPANPPKKEERPKTPTLPKNPGAIGPPAPLPYIREYVKDDPVLKYRNQPNQGPLGTPNNQPNLGPTKSPSPNSFIPTPQPSPSPVPGTTTTPTTNPTQNPTRKEEKNPIPIFPPLPIINPQNPTVGKPEEKKTPVIQTPGGSGCCTPPGINQANQNLDGIKLLLEGIDLSLLGIINTKLGPQISGGLSGYLQDRFTKLWKSRVVDRALNLMATAAAIHNAVMLSRNIGSTLIATLGNALSIIGIKDGDDVAQNFSTVIGDQIENIVKGLIGAENYTQLTQTWAKANRIYQSAINIYQLMTDSLFGITEGLEQTAKYTGKIGNALRKSGVILENSYNWMSETFNFSSGKNRKIDRVIQGLQSANEIASDLESITSEFRSVTENVAEIGTQVNVIKGEIDGKEDEKKNQEDQGKQSSQSPTINKSDLIKPN